MRMKNSIVAKKKKLKKEKPVHLNQEILRAKTRVCGIIFCAELLSNCFWSIKKRSKVKQKLS